MAAEAVLDEAQGSKRIIIGGVEFTEDEVLTVVTSFSKTDIRTALDQKFETEDERNRAKQARVLVAETLGHNLRQKILATKILAGVNSISITLSNDETIIIEADYIEQLKEIVELWQDDENERARVLELAEINQALQTPAMTKAAVRDKKRKARNLSWDEKIRKRLKESIGENVSETFPDLDSIAITDKNLASLVSEFERRSTQPKDGLWPGTLKRYRDISLEIQKLRQELRDGEKKTKRKKMQAHFRDAAAKFIRYAPWGFAGAMGVYGALALLGMTSGFVIAPALIAGLIATSMAVLADKFLRKPFEKIAEPFAKAASLGEGFKTVWRGVNIFGDNKKKAADTNIAAPYVDYDTELATAKKTASMATGAATGVAGLFGGLLGVAAAFPEPTAELLTAALAAVAEAFAPIIVGSAFPILGVLAVAALGGFYLWQRNSKNQIADKKYADLIAKRDTLEASAPPAPKF